MRHPSQKIIKRITFNGTEEDFLFNVCRTSIGPVNVCSTILVICSSTETRLDRQVVKELTRSLSISIDVVIRICIPRLCLAVMRELRMARPGTPTERPSTSCFSESATFPLPVSPVSVPAPAYLVNSAIQHDLYARMTRINRNMIQGIRFCEDEFCFYIS